MADVVFIVRGVQFWSHSAIWTFSSPVVADLLETSNFDEGYESVHVDDLEPEAFRLLIRYLHTGDVICK
jgi:BTB/POZ domain